MDIANVYSQLFLVNFCNLLGNQAKLSNGEPLLRPDEMLDWWCWPKVFQQWRLDQNLSYPIESPTEFYSDLKTFLIGPANDSEPDPGSRFSNRFGKK